MADQQQGPSAATAHEQPVITIMCCKPFFRIFPKRYFLALLAFFIVLLQISMRTIFTMTLVFLTTKSPAECSNNGTNFTTSFQESNKTVNCNCTVSDDDYLDWSKLIYSQEMATYFYGYVLTQIPGGLLSQRVAAYKVFGCSCFVSFLIFLIIPFVIDYWPAVLVCRLLQGLVEGVSLPAMNGVLSMWAHSGEKTRLVTIMASGAYLSGAIGLGMTGSIICALGWRAPYYIFSTLGMVFSIFWLIIITESPLTDPNIGTLEKFNFMKSVTGRTQGASKAQAQSVDWKGILTSLPVTALFVASFCRCWVFFLLLTEQPQYFRDVFKYNIEENGALSTLPHICMTIVVLFGGMLADLLMSKNILSKTATRKLFNCGGFGVEAACILALSFIPVNLPSVAVAVLTIGVGFSGFAISGYQVNAHDLAPDRASILSGVAKLGSIAGIIMPYVVGYIVKNDLPEEWFLVFRITAGIHFLGVIYYAIFASGTVQPWSGFYNQTVQNQEPGTYGAVPSSSSLPAGPILESEVGFRTRLLRESQTYPPYYRSMNLGE